MIEIDGVAYPLEPGKQYLIAVDINSISRHTQETLAQTLQEQFNVSVVVVRVQGRPADVLRVIGPIAPEISA